MATLYKALQQISLGLIAGYRWVFSPWVGGQCRFTPTCSAYATQAISQIGLGKGLCLTLWRLLRCHRFANGGIDPVPTLKSGRVNSTKKGKL